MRTCIIETKGAPNSLIRFTEVRCFFDYNNQWLDYFDKVVLCEEADRYQKPAWRIKAGQHITTNMRTKYKDKQELDLRNSTETYNWETKFWDTAKEMKHYRGTKQEYLYRNYMTMVLKSKSKNIYFANNEPLAQIRNHEGNIWVPASGTMAGQIKYNNPKADITIFDINPTQIKFSKWLNSLTSYPTAESVTAFIGSLGKVSTSETFDPLITNWVPVEANYTCLDILDKDLESPTIMSNILKFLPAYHKHGSKYITEWEERNQGFIL